MDEYYWNLIGSEDDHQKGAKSNLLDILRMVPGVGTAIDTYLERRFQYRLIQKGFGFSD